MTEHQYKSKCLSYEEVVAKQAKEIERLKTENEKIRESLMDCFSQGTHVRLDALKNPDKYVYDHMCLSAYEHAQDLLIELGMIKLEECSRR